MRARRVVPAATALLLLLVVAAGPVRADEPVLADPVAAVPQRVETFVSPAPMTMLVEEVELMLEMARRQAESGPPLLGRPDELPDDPVPGGVSRTIEIEVPPVVNRTPFFKFEDVTDREAEDPSTKRSIEQRRAAVEAYRQSLVKSGARGSKSR